MRWYMLFSLLFAVDCVGSPLRAQEQPEENVSYEKLKVLEPLIGTWSANWTKNETGAQNEMQMTFSWAPKNRMIVSVGKARTADAGKTLDTQPWEDGGPRGFYVWNSKAGSIEQTWFFTMMGMAIHSTVMPKGNGEFEMKTFHQTGDLGTYDITMVVTENECRQKFVSRDSANGDASKDFEIVMKRVK